MSIVSNPTDKANLDRCPAPEALRRIVPIAGRDDSTQPLTMLRELVHLAVDKLERSLAFLARVEQASRDTRDPGSVAWRDLRRLAGDQVKADEMGLAYLLDESIRDLAPEGWPVETEGEEFEPFGISRDGIAYLVRFDPANMDVGIIGRIPLGQPERSEGGRHAA